MDVEYLLSLEKFRELLDVLICLFHTACKSTNFFVVGCNFLLFSFVKWLELNSKTDKKNEKGSVF